MWVKLLVGLSVFAAVMLTMALGGLAIWFYANIAVFIINHWPWFVGGLGALVVLGIVSSRARGRKASPNLNTK